MPVLYFMLSRHRWRNELVFEGKFGSSALRALSMPTTGSVPIEQAELNQYTRLIPVDVLRLACRHETE